MKIGAIVQARMSSQRLPQKTLLAVRGKPLLQYLLERLQKCSCLDSVIVATSSDSSDDPIAEFCGQHQVDCHRGSLANVAQRFFDIVNQYSLSAFVRLSGDSPLLDQELVDRAVRIFRDGNLDLVTNVLIRTFPKGQSVEVCRSETFCKIFPQMTQEDFEHVTKFFYRTPDQFLISNFESNENLGEVQLSVDTSADLHAISSIVSLMTHPHWEYGLTDILRLHRLIGTFLG